jgi:hypothetical protein
MWWVDWDRRFLSEDIRLTGEARSSGQADADEVSSCRAWKRRERVDQAALEFELESHTVFNGNRARDPRPQLGRTIEDDMLATGQQQLAIFASERAVKAEEAGDFHARRVRE